MTKSSMPPRSSSRESKKSKPSIKKKKKTVYWRRRFTVLFLLLFVCGAGYLGYLYTVSKDTLKTITVDADSNVEIPSDQSVKVKPTAFMLLGFDTRDSTGGLNSDVMMIAAFNPRTKSATVVSIPRDSKIELSGYKSRKANAYYAKFYSNAKSNGLDKSGAEKKAKQDIKEMFGQYFDIPLTYMGTINFKGFADVVDAIGGIDVDVKMDMRYVDNADGTNIDLKKGPQHLNGTKALDYVRYRKSNDGKNMSSDFDRNNRESEALGEIVDKLKSFSGVSKISKVIRAVGNNMRLDLPSAEVENMMMTYFGISRKDITFIPLEGVWKSPYVYLDADKLELAKAALQKKLAE